MHCFGIINVHGGIIVSGGAVSNYEFTQVRCIDKWCIRNDLMVIFSENYIDMAMCSSSNIGVHIFIISFYFVS